MSVLESLGGDNGENRRSVITHGVDLAKREGRRYPGDAAVHFEATTRGHIAGIINGETTALWDWVEDFWNRTLTDIEGGAVKESTPTIAESDEQRRHRQRVEAGRKGGLARGAAMRDRTIKVGRGIEDDGGVPEEARLAIEGLRNRAAKAEQRFEELQQSYRARGDEIRSLRVTLDRTTEEKARLQHLNARQAESIEQMTSRINTLEGAIERMKHEREVQGGGSAMGSDLSIEVLRRVLGLAFPEADQQRVIDEAINLASQVAQRTAV